MLMIDFLGGDSIAGGQMKAEYGWADNLVDNLFVSGNGTNASGFTALPGGNRTSGSGDFGSAGVFGTWWTPPGKWVTISHAFENILSVGNPRTGYSVRCIKD